MKSKKINKNDINKITYLLEYIKAVFEKHQITYWLDAGTLLKTVRNSNIIPSSDIDFGVWNSDIDKVIKACNDFKQKGFQIQYQGKLSYFEDAVKIQIPNEYSEIISNMAFDIYLYSKIGEHAVRRNINRPIGFVGSCLMRLFGEASIKRAPTLASAKYKFFIRLKNSLPKTIINLFLATVLLIYKKYCTTLWYVFPNRYFLKIDTIYLYGVQFPIPSDVYNYLSLRYGFYWFIPTKRYHLTDGNFLEIKKMSRLPDNKTNFRTVENDDILIKQRSIKLGLFKLSGDVIKKLNKKNSV